jgi:methylmalonyl-CoA mutase N-terminal domain/subunit
MRTNQVILNETRIDCVSDPLGGSYYMESLTDKIEEQALKMMAEIEDRGGFCQCVADGFLRNLLREQVIKWRSQIDTEEKIIVGLNDFKIDAETEIPPFSSDASKTADIAIKRVKEWKQSRDNVKVQDALKGVEQAMQAYNTPENAGLLMPALIDAARAKSTLGEMMGAIYKVTGGRVYGADYRGF